MANDNPTTETKTPKNGAKAATEEIQIPRLETVTGHYKIVGLSPLIHNRLSEKARRQIIFPPLTKSRAQRQVTLKHNPMEEFRASPYRLRDGAPTLLALPSASFHKAMGSVAKNVSGTNAKQIGQLSWVNGDYVPIYGTPVMLMSVVRSADINRTPDIRTRAIMPRWACEIEVRCTLPYLTLTTATLLLASAGLTMGVGDWRNEKGSGNYGAFRICEPNDPTFEEIKREGRSIQEQAMTSPQFYDLDTEDLYNWWVAEAHRRDLHPKTDDAEETDEENEEVEA